MYEIKDLLSIYPHTAIYASNTGHGQNCYPATNISYTATQFEATTYQNHAKWLEVWKRKAERHEYLFIFPLDFPPMVFDNVAALRGLDKEIMALMALHSYF